MKDVKTIGLNGVSEQRQPMWGKIVDLSGQEGRGGLRAGREIDSELNGEFQPVPSRLAAFSYEPHHLKPSIPETAVALPY
jgi:hypothetical protein